MLDLDTDFLSLAEADCVVLHAYQLAEKSLVAESPRPVELDGEEMERTRWVTRIGEVDGVPRDCLAPIHGRLIALGFLQFQLQGRDAGVVYRITSEGRAALAAADGQLLTVAPVRKSA